MIWIVTNLPAPAVIDREIAVPDASYCGRDGWWGFRVAVSSGRWIEFVDATDALQRRLRATPREYTDVQSTIQSTVDDRWTWRKVKYRRRSTNDDRDEVACRGQR